MSKNNLSFFRNTAIIILSLLFFPSCNKLIIFKINKPLLGTEINLTIIAKSKAKASVAADEVFREIERIENIMSTHRPESDIYRINRFAYHKPTVSHKEDIFNQFHYIKKYKER